MTPSPLSLAKIILLAALIALLGGCSAAQTTAAARTPVVVKLPIASGGDEHLPAPATRVISTPAASPQPPPTAATAATATPPPGVTPEPPLMFQSKDLLWGAKPVAYIDNACEYLRLRWDPENAPPGAFIAAIMYHRVKEKPGEPGVSDAYFRQTMRQAHRLGYQTITARQAADFLERNAKIPPRSLMLFVDDRRVPVIMNHFMPFLEKYDWTVISSWIIANSDKIPGLWQRIEAAYATGRVDVESHGLRHLYIVDSTPKKKIKEELNGPFPYFEKHFGYRPVAFIWPGGNLTPYAVHEARKAGYRIGFTIYPNGPIMFNWIPQQKAERAIGDPLLLLPRYHADSVKSQLAIAIKISEQARQQALAHYPQEAAWYSQHCGGQLPPPPQSP